MLRTHVRPASVAALAVLATAVAGIAGCGTAGHGTAAGAVPPSASTAGSANSPTVHAHGTARYQRVRPAVAPRPNALPAAVRWAYCAAGEIPVPFRGAGRRNCGVATCSYSPADVGSRPDRPGAGTSLRPPRSVLVLPCGWPVGCVCPPYWRLNRPGGSVALPLRGLCAEIPPMCPEP